MTHLQLKAEFNVNTQIQVENKGSYHFSPNIRIATSMPLYTMLCIRADFLSSWGPV